MTRPPESCLDETQLADLYAAIDALPALTDEQLDAFAEVLYDSETGVRLIR